MAYYKQKQNNVGFWHSVREIVVLLLIVFLIRTFVFGLYQVPTGSMETTMLVGERFFADKLTPLFTNPKRGEIIAFNDPLFNYSKNSVIRLYQEYVGWPIWPWGPANWTKRVIGIPGDHVKGVIEDGKPVVYLNDKKLDEPYLNQYPLLAVWKTDPRLSEEIELLWRSYDPAASYNDQPFYRVNPALIVDPRHIKPEYIKAINATLLPNGGLVKEPYKPINEEDESYMIKRKEGYWTHTDEFDVILGPDQYWLMGDNRRGSNDSRFFGPVEKRLIHGKILFRIWSSDSSESWWIVDLMKHPIDFWKRMRWNRFFQRIK